jgi:hypothetical protein
LDSTHFFLEGSIVAPFCWIERGAHSFLEASIVAPFLLDKADSNQDHDTADSLTPRTSQSFGICRTTRTGQIQTTTKWSPGAPNHP